jgi:hypothetical protein
MKLEDIIAAACEELNCSYENNALWFEVLVNQAIRSHKTMNKYVHKNANLVVTDSKATLPSDWFRITHVSLCNTTQIFCLDTDYCIQGDTIVFNTAVHVPDGTKIVVHYYGLNTDKDDNIIIPDDWERMLVAYIGWKYTRRYINDFGVAVMQNYQREYQTQKLANV